MEMMEKKKKPVKLIIGIVVAALAIIGFAFNSDIVKEEKCGANGCKGQDGKVEENNKCSANGCASHRTPEEEAARAKKKEKKHEENGCGANGCDTKK